MHRAALVGWIIPFLCSHLPAQDVTIHIDANHSLHAIGPAFTGLCLEDVNHEIYGGLYSQMIFGESFAEPADEHGVSKEWSPVTRGDVKLNAAIDRSAPFVGTQSQAITFDGIGEAGVANRGLHHGGMVFQLDRLYEGYVWLRSNAAQAVAVSLESEDGFTSLARQTFSTTPGDAWQRFEFTLTPHAGGDAKSVRGQFSIRMTQPGSLVIGHAFLQPGPWGRFHDLPVRRDVAEKMLATGIRFIRYGGSMVNAPDYRVSHMMAARDRRPPYEGHWYPYSTNGWSVLDFLNFCEAANVEPIPDLSIDETAGDLERFLRYATSPADRDEGELRAADGHPRPYRLKYIELGNEEKVDDVYVDKFRTLAGAIWRIDPSIVVVVGDFEYRSRITNPFDVDNATSGIRSLQAQAQIMAFAKKFNNEVWFDVHVWTEALEPSPAAHSLISYVDAIDGIADGAKHRVVVFELNANKHDLTRALSNADAMLDILHDGRLPMVSSANALQVDGQNDNGWDQGLVFLNPSKTWLQPPAYAMQMFGVANGAAVLSTDVKGDGLKIVAMQSADHQQVSLLLLNKGDRKQQTLVRLDGFTPQQPTATVTTLGGELTAVDKSDDPLHVVPQHSTVPLQDGSMTLNCPPHALMQVEIR